MVILFILLFGLVLLNMAAAGAAALLAIRLPAIGRGRRAVLASAATGAVTTLMLGGVILEDLQQGNESGAVQSLVAALFIFGAGIVSIPGALVMGRMAERPPPVGDTFD